MNYRFSQLSEQKMRKHFLRLIIGAVAGLLLSLYLSVEPAIFHINSLFAIILGIMISYIIGFFNRLLNQITPWNSSIIIRIIASLLTYVIISFSAIKGILYLIDTVGEPIYFLEDKQINLKLVIILSFGFFLYTIIDLLIYSYRSYSTGELHKIKADRKQIDLQLNALKAQLSPHFLFNSLNTASSLMSDQINDAESYIRKLARLYEYTIESYHSSLISLHEEIAFVKDYFHLLKTKHGDQIEMNMNISELHQNTKIPPLALQMLVENAIKHNIINSQNRLSLQIHSSNEWITVTNNKTKIPAKNTSFNIGLKNIKERYKLLTDKHIIIKDEQDFIISIPIIE